MVNLRARCTIVAVAALSAAALSACNGASTAEGQPGAPSVPTTTAVGAEGANDPNVSSSTSTSPSSANAANAATATTAAKPPARPTEQTPSTAPTTASTVAALGPGASGPKVQALQARLAELGYSVGTVDGRYGDATGSAVMAFQKVEQLAVDGVPGPQTLARLDQPQGAIPTGGALRIEIDLARQVLFVVGAGQTRIFNTSTGNDEPFTWPDGTPGLAYTPTGTFAVYYRVDGIDDGALGEMYRPLYFHTDWAVHGSSYVPAYPASHGCARVSNADQNWIWDHIPTGTPVVVY